MSGSAQPGAIALVGSGEYLPVMKETDDFLLDIVKSKSSAPRVVLIPTASGQESNGPKYWTDLGLNHFRELGVSVQSALIIKPQDASNPEILALLEEADFYYFSGGDPTYLLSTFADSPALEIIRRKQAAGTVLAGCSAGAMAMSAYTTSIRAAMGGQVQWLPGWGFVRDIVTFPHFDRMASFVGSDFMRKMLQNVPAGCRMVGIDEDTALIRTQRPDSPGMYQWRVTGRQTVSVFDAMVRPKYIKAVKMCLCNLLCVLCYIELPSR